MKQISNSRNEDYGKNVSFLSFSYSRQDSDLCKKSSAIFKEERSAGPILLLFVFLCFCNDQLLLSHYYYYFKP